MPDGIKCFVKGVRDEQAVRGWISSRILADVGDESDGIGETEPVGGRKCADCKPKGPLFWVQGFSRKPKHTGTAYSGCSFSDTVFDFLFYN